MYSAATVVIFTPRELIREKHKPASFRYIRPPLRCCKIPSKSNDDSSPRTYSPNSPLRHTSPPQATPRSNAAAISKRPSALSLPFGGYRISYSILRPFIRITTSNLMWRQDFFMALGEECLWISSYGALNTSSPSFCAPRSSSVNGPYIWQNRKAHQHLPEFLMWSIWWWSMQSLPLM